MTAEVVPLGRCMPATGEPNGEVVDMLREMLAQAERGEIIGFGYAMVEGNAAVSCGWASGVADRHLMCTAASMLQYRIVATILDD